MKKETISDASERGSAIVSAQDAEEQGAAVQNDMTTGPEWRKLVLFALPIMAGQFLQQLYNTVDGIVVGNFVGDAALGAVGACTTMAFLFLAFSIGFGNGCGVLIAQLFGAKQLDTLKRAAATAILLLGGMGLAMTVLGWFGADWFVTELLNIQQPALIELAQAYFSIYALGLVFQFLYNCIASILRAMGDSRATLYFLCVSALLNLGLDVLFVAGFDWGVAGAAVATVLAQAVCVAVCFVYLFARYPIFRFRRGEFRFSPALGRACLRMGVPMTIQHCIISSGNLLMQRLVNHFGQDTMAAFTCGLRFENYCMVPALSIQQAMTMFTGQNIGAGELTRVIRGWKAAEALTLGITVCISTVLFVFAPSLAGLFGVEDEALRQAVEYLRFISYMMLIFSAYQATNGVIQGSGDVVFASLCSLTTLCSRVSLAYLLVFVFDFGYAVVWRTVPVGWVLGLVLALLRLRSGKWREKSVIGGESNV